jgi:hypothetical protein
MDPDLRDLLAAWLGGEEPDSGRRDQLLARLRADEAFRQAFAAEVHMLGMLRAVQAPEPRWLRLADELGWSLQAPSTAHSLEERVMRVVRAQPRPRRWGRWAFAAAAAVAFVSLAVWLRPAAPPGAAGPATPVVELATVVRLDGVAWHSGPVPVEGDAVPAGRLRIGAGRLTLAFYNGVSLTVEGPADLDLLAADRVFVRRGKLRSRVPPGAEGFTVLIPGAEVVELGSEFGLNVEPDGTARVMTFDGQAAVSVLGEGSRTLRSALVEANRSVAIDPKAALIRDVFPEPGAFAPPPAAWPTTLHLDPDYVATVLRSRPWGYWRFEALDGDGVANEIAGRPALRAVGDVRLEGSPGRNHYALFRPEHPEQAFLMDGDWAPPREGGYALEFWVRADAPGLRALVSLIARDEGPEEKHVALVELTGRGGQSAHQPCVVRFLDRWPPGLSGGVNVFSRRTYVPDRWHHLVAQKVDSWLHLYVDGRLVAGAPALSDANTTACRLLVGRLKQWPPSRLNEIRPFAGRVDELAVYERPLSLEEIQQHHRRGNGTATRQ